MAVFKAAHIVLPAPGTDISLWAALACDQFTSQPDYWEKAQALTQDVPSTLHITLPEVYLESDNVEQRIAQIHATMQAYEKDVLTRKLHGFVYVERTTDSGTRQGLVGAVDLEAYSYEKGALPPVRPSENTVVSRIPPRLAVRRGASLETPHIMMLIDDDKKSVIEPLATQKDTLTQLYDTPLMLGGGHVAGWGITQPAHVAALEQAIDALGTQAAFDVKYPNAAGKPPITLAVGDGNHSLATAKAYWEEVKAGLTPAQRETHPARFCLVELVNIHSDAIFIEPIHRAVFGANGHVFTDAFTAWLAAHGADLDVRCTAAEDVQAFTFIANPSDEVPRMLCITSAPHPLAVGTLEMFLADFCAENSAVKVDYIHGVDAVRTLAQEGAVGVLLPEFAKSDLFKGVVLGGVLPKKTFSMGEATEKRYYLECRKINL